MPGKPLPTTQSRVHHPFTGARVSKRGTRDLRTLPKSARHVARNQRPGRYAGQATTHHAVPQTPSNQSARVSKRGTRDLRTLPKSDRHTLSRAPTVDQG